MKGCRFYCINRRLWAVVFSDIDMPGAVDVELAKWIREHRPGLDVLLAGTVPPPRRRKRGSPLRARPRAKTLQGASSPRSHSSLARRYQKTIMLTSVAIAQIAKATKLSRFIGSRMIQKASRPCLRAGNSDAQKQPRQQRSGGAQRPFGACNEEALG